MPPDTLRLGLTTSPAPASDLRARARLQALQAGLPFCPRQEQSLEALCRAHRVDGLVVIERRQTVLRLGGEPLAYHPNMAKVRIQNLRRGGGDPMLRAMSLREGDAVLDCTCGLAADAAVVAHIAGDSGRVQALEASPVLALLVGGGVRTYEHPVRAITRALRRIDVVCADYATTLPHLPDNSWDVVYFDPMFEHTLETSSGFDLVRLLARPDQLEPRHLCEARRVARRCVVMKDRLPGHRLRHLGLEIREFGARICYGVLDATTL